MMIFEEIYVATPVSVAVHPQGGFPMSDETIRVSVDDEGAGPFIVLDQIDETLESNRVTLTMAELQTIVVEAKKLIAAWPDFHIQTGYAKDPSCRGPHPEDLF